MAEIEGCDEPTLPEAWEPKIGSAGPVEVTPADDACFPVTNCVDPETGEPVPITVVLDLSNLDPDGDGLINVEIDGDVMVPKFATFQGEVCTADGPVTVTFCIDDGDIANPTYLGYIDTAGVLQTGPPPAAPCPQPPTVDVERDYVCNAEAGFYDEVVTTYADGVEVGELVTPTEYTCADHDVEYECRNGMTFAVLYDVTVGVPTEVAAVATGGACDETCDVPFTPECVKIRRYTVGYDNGFTPGAVSNDCGAQANLVRYQWPFTVDYWEVNGQQVGQGDTTLGPTASWTPQLQAWADFFTANDLNPNATAAFGFISSPTWRYAEITGCDPQATYGRLVKTRTDTGCEYIVYPVLETETVEYGFRYATLDCEGNVEVKWLNADGKPMATPDDAACWVSCTVEFSTLIQPDAVSPCDTVIQFGCDNADGTPIVVLQTFCGDDLTPATEIYTQASWLAAQTADDLVEHDLVGDFVDCESGEVIPPVEPELCDTPTIRECVIGCETAFQATTGRPNNAATWALVGPSGPEVVGGTYSEFSDAMAAAGYTEWIDGEAHWFCPCPGTADDGWVLQVDGETAVKLQCVPIGKTAGPQPTIECAELTVGKNDDRRDDLLDEIVDTVGCTIVECASAGGDGTPDAVYDLDDAAATEQSFGIGQVGAGGEDGVKFDTGTALSAELTAVHDAIIACIESGGVADVVIVDQDGTTSELLLDTVGGDGNPQYWYTGTVVTAGSGGGKVRYMSTTCSTSDGDPVKAQMTVGCNDDVRDGLLDEIASQTFPVIGEAACVEVDGVATSAYPAGSFAAGAFTPAGWLQPGPDGLTPVTGTVVVVDCDCPCGTPTK